MLLENVLATRYWGTHKCGDSLANWSGIGPMTRSIIAKCSKLSCVWKSARPVNSSIRIQPKDQRSHIVSQPSSATSPEVSGRSGGADK